MIPPKSRNTKPAPRKRAKPKQPKMVEIEIVTVPDKPENPMYAEMTARIMKAIDAKDPVGRGALEFLDSAAVLWEHIMNAAVPDPPVACLVVNLVADFARMEREEGRALTFESINERVQKARQEWNEMIEVAGYVTSRYSLPAES